MKTLSLLVPLCAASLALGPSTPAAAQTEPSPSPGAQSTGALPNNDKANNPRSKDSQAGDALITGAGSNLKRSSNRYNLSTTNQAAQSRQPNGAPLDAQIGCGAASSFTCRVVVHRLSQSMTESFTLIAIPMETPLAAARAVCAGRVPAAVVQADAADAVMREKACGEHLLVIAKPIYPNFGFLLVADNNPENRLSAMVGRAAGGHRLTIAAGAPGSAARLTMDRILDANPAWKRTVAYDDGPADTAQKRLAGGGVDAIFVMGTPDAPELRRLFDPGLSDPPVSYKIAAVDVPASFYGETVASGGGPLYQAETLSLRGAGRIETIAAPVVVTINAEVFNDAGDGTRLGNSLGVAVQDARRQILKDAGAPRDWERLASMQ